MEDHPSYLGFQSGDGKSLKFHFLLVEMGCSTDA